MKTTEEFKALLTNIYDKGNTGATFQEVMELLQAELGKMNESA